MRTEDGVDTDTLLWAFASILSIHVAARLWISANELDTSRMVLAGVLTICAAAVLLRRYVRIALVVVALIELERLVSTFPFSANHSMIEFLAVTALACFNLRDAKERDTVLQGLRLGTAIILFHTGFQKFLYGTYFDGMFLGYEIAKGDRFAQLFQWVLPAEEFSRLLAFDVDTAGAGPFSVQSPLFLLISNSVYVFECGVPFLLIWRRTRLWAGVAALGFTLGIQLGAREFMFGLLYSNLMLLFLPFALNRYLIPLFALIYLGLIGVTYGFLPEIDFN